MANDLSRPLCSSYPLDISRADRSKLYDHPCGGAENGRQVGMGDGICGVVACVLLRRLGKKFPGGRAAGGSTRLGCQSSRNDASGTPGWPARTAPLTWNMLFPLVLTAENAMLGQDLTTTSRDDM
jgi:hypothetical protein